MVSIQKYILMRLITSSIVVTAHLIKYFIIIHNNIKTTKKYNFKINAVVEHSYY